MFDEKKKVNETAISAEECDDAAGFVDFMDTDESNVMEGTADDFDEED